MKITKNLVMLLFKAASMLRWNDKMRPIELCELDKQAHKMIIAYMLARLEEKHTSVSWVGIVEGGIFELLQRTVLTDLRPQIFHRIKENREKYRSLNEWAYQELSPAIEPLGRDFCQRYQEYFQISDNSISKRIVSAAHFYATRWEFAFIERANPNGYEIDQIRRDILRDNQKYYDLEGMKLLALYPNYNDFINLCGELRFQQRWSTTPRLPKTSVLGHMLMVAILSYLFSLQLGACSARRINNFYTGLFHDLPEVLTRDIISPVKKSTSGLADLIKQYEKEEMEKVYALLDPEWHDEIRLFTEDEFANIVHIDGSIVKKSSEEINQHFNHDNYKPRDGSLVKAVDEICAFVEAYTSNENGISAPELSQAMEHIRGAYLGKKIAGISFDALLSEFG
ncbi:MAG: HD domain-containing protein [Dehalococcoidales bacterium]|jgi:putative hydrolase of HD superfamily|nr:HD domain-containing protein [Dehalococcoidales bacterium]MDX9986171.1 HD domain-containing protein [Dehalococcoidales bacterium]